MNYYDGLVMGELATYSEIKSLSLLTVCVCYILCDDWYYICYDDLEEITDGARVDLHIYSRC